LRALLIKRARLGLFLAFRVPTAIPGLSVASFMRSALNARLQGVDKNGDVDPTDPARGGISMRDFRNTMRETFRAAQGGRELRDPLRQRWLQRR